MPRGWGPGASGGGRRADLWMRGVTLHKVNGYGGAPYKMNGCGGALYKKGWGRAPVAEWCGGALHKMNGCGGALDN